MLKSYQIIIDKAKARGPIPIVVAGAHSESILKATIQSREENVIEPILIGKSHDIHQLSEKFNLTLENIQIIDEEEEKSIAHQAASLLHDRKALALMKGNISTSTLLKAVLDSQYNLRKGKLLSHIALLNIPSYHKLLLVTDGGVVIRPDLIQKKEILKNAIDVLHQLGVDPVKAAVLAASEKPAHDMPETMDAVALVDMCKHGEFGSTIIEGPMALDVAFSPDAARIKQLESQVSGDPDLLLVPDISCGNIFCKGLVYLAEAEICGVVVGAKIPIALISRAERHTTWLLSIALANVLA